MCDFCYKYKHKQKKSHNLPFTLPDWYVTTKYMDVHYNNI